jgi:hypothetical protein
MRPVSTRLVVRVLVIYAAAIIGATARFGRGFLGQFFLSPFQMFIVAPWLFAFVCVRLGYMPMKSGDRVYRAIDPSNFWREVWFLTVVGAFMFVFTFVVSWLVMSRPR